MSKQLSEYDHDLLLDQFEDVRQTGKVNMLDFCGVQVVAHQRGHHDLVAWIEQAGVDNYADLLSKYEEHHNTL